MNKMIKLFKISKTAEIEKDPDERVRTFGSERSDAVRIFMWSAERMET